MKNTLFSIAILTICFGQSLFSQNCNVLKNRILIVGDSWAYLPWSYGSLDDNLEKYGFSDAKAYSNSDISVNGKKAEQMTDSIMIADIQQALDNNLHIDIVCLSIGGNDFLDDWNKSMSQLETDSLLDVIIDRTDTIIKIINNMKSNLAIYLPMYDFPNFNETISVHSAPSSHPFYSTWDNMGQPSFLELNTQLLNYSQKITTLANLYPNVYFVDASGLMQNIYGQTTPLQVAPGGTYPSDSVNVPGGYPLYPSPLNAVADYGFFYDSFHFSQDGYRHFYDYHFKHFFFNSLRRKRDIAVTSISTEDGSITNSSFNDSTIIIGKDSSSNITKALLSFNLNIPSGEKIGIASIFLKRDSLINTKPIDDKILVTIKSGYFGTSNSLEISDFNDNGDGQDSACVYGNISSDGSWMRIDIPKSLIPFIDSNGVTQFKLESASGSIGKLFFNNGIDTSSIPQLDIYYESNPISIPEQKIVKDIDVFPNPFLEELNLKLDFNYNGFCEMIDISGKVNYIEVNNNRIITKNLTKGFYIIRFNKDDITFQTKVIKN